MTNMIRCSRSTDLPLTWTARNITCIQMRECLVLVVKKVWSYRQWSPRPMQMKCRRQYFFEPITRWTQQHKVSWAITQTANKTCWTIQTANISSIISKHPIQFSGPRFSIDIFKI